MQQFDGTASSGGGGIVEDAAASDTAKMNNRKRTKGASSSISAVSGVSKTSGLSTQSDSSSSDYSHLSNPLVDESEQATLRARSEGQELVNLGGGASSCTSSICNGTTATAANQQQQLMSLLMSSPSLFYQCINSISSASVAKQLQNNCSPPNNANSSLPNSQPSSGHSSTPQMMGNNGSSPLPSIPASLSSLLGTPNAVAAMSPPEAALMAAAIAATQQLNVAAAQQAPFTGGHCPLPSHPPPPHVHLPQAHPQFHPHHLAAPQLMPQPQFTGSIPSITPKQLYLNNVLNSLILQSQERQQRIPNELLALMFAANQQKNEFGGGQQQMPTFGGAGQQMPSVPSAAAPFLPQTQQVKQQNKAGGGVGNGQTEMNGGKKANFGHKSVKRRKSAQSQASVNSSQGTGGSSTTLSMNSQQPASNGTPTTPMTPITSFSSIYERMNMDEETEKASPTTGTKIGRMPSKKMTKSEQQKMLTKQKRNSGGGGNGSPNDNLNKEVTSGGRVPKKTRRISMEVDGVKNSPPAASSSSVGTVKMELGSQHSLNHQQMANTDRQMRMANNNSIGPPTTMTVGHESISPTGSLGDSSSSPTNTIASPMEGEVRTFYCEWESCQDEFPSEEAFVAHVNDVHVRAEQSPQFFCRWESCSRKEPFNAQYMLAQHVRKHSGEKPYICDHVGHDGVGCVKRYSRLENLKTHQRTHTGDRPYKCAHCPKMFTNASDKAKHQNRTHKPDKDYACPVHRCSKQYTDPSSLRKHVFHEHGEAVWLFAKANKEAKKAKDYGVIGIRPDGTPFAMPSGTSSSDEDREVDVMSTTPPPAGSRGAILRGFKENHGGDGGANAGGAELNGHAGGMTKADYYGYVNQEEQKTEIKQEPKSPPMSIGQNQLMAVHYNNRQHQHSIHQMKHLFNGTALHQSPKGGNGGIGTAIPLSAQNHQKHQQQKQIQMNWQNNGQLPSEIVGPNVAGASNGSPLNSKRGIVVAAVGPIRRQQQQQPDFPSPHEQQQQRHFQEWPNAASVQLAHHHLPNCPPSSFIPSTANANNYFPPDPLPQQQPQQQQNHRRHQFSSQMNGSTKVLHNSAPAGFNDCQIPCEVGCYNGGGGGGCGGGPIAAIHEFIPPVGNQHYSKCYKNSPSADVVFLPSQMPSTDGFTDHQHGQYHNLLEYSASAANCQHFNCHCSQPKHQQQQPMQPQHFAAATAAFPIVNNGHRSRHCSGPEFSLYGHGQCQQQQMVPAQSNHNHPQQQQQHVVYHQHPQHLGLEAQQHNAQHHHHPHHVSPPCHYAGCGGQQIVQQPQQQQMPTQHDPICVAINDAVEDEFDETASSLISDLNLNANKDPQQPPPKA